MSASYRIGMLFALVTGICLPGGAGMKKFIGKVLMNRYEQDFGSKVKYF